MREIKFRAKSIHKNEWWIGYYIYSEYENKHFIIQNAIDNNQPNGSISFAHFTEVIPETLGQYTGIKDKKGVEIYEGDITRDGYIIMFCNEKSLFAEFFKNGYTGIFNIAKYPIDPGGIEIIGNIHEINPNNLTGNQ